MVSNVKRKGQAGPRTVETSKVFDFLKKCPPYRFFSKQRRPRERGGTTLRTWVEKYFFRNLRTDLELVVFCREDRSFCGGSDSGEGELEGIIFQRPMSLPRKVNAERKCKGGMKERGRGRIGDDVVWRVGQRRRANDAPQSRGMTRIRTSGGQMCEDKNYVLCPPLLLFACSALDLVTLMISQNHHYSIDNTKGRWTCLAPIIRVISFSELFHSEIFVS